MEVVLQAPMINRQTISLIDHLSRDGDTGIIAEFKRKSPSKGYINERADVVKITSDYEKHGATGLSILTDTQFFGGSYEDLSIARASSLPILRKDFIIDEYQVAETKAMGADVILLIAACLTPFEVLRFSTTAKEFGLEVLLEIHGEEELAHIHPGIRLVGINNRNLKTFNVDIDHSIKLAGMIPSDCLKIAESGITDEATIKSLKAHGFNGFLIGENFMKNQDPGKAFAGFIKNLKYGSN